MDDFAMIGMDRRGPPLILVIDAKLPYKTLAELVADAKANPNKNSFGTSGPATSPREALAQLNAAAARPRSQAVPYRGSGEAATAVAASAIQGTFTFYSQGKPLADSGRVRALAIASPQRIATWPEVPTMQELGYPISTIAVSSALRRPPRRRRRSSPSQQAAQRHGAIAGVQAADGGARHDGAGREHARAACRNHAPRNRPSGRPGRAHRHQDDGADALMELLSSLSARIVRSLAIIAAIAALNFVIVHLAPGDVADVLAGESGAASPDFIADLRTRFGLDQPLWMQFAVYMGRIAQSTSATPSASAGRWRPWCSNGCPPHCH